MKADMRNIMSLILIFTTFAGVNAQNALAPSPEWKANVKVVDEAGQPIEGADVTIGYYVPPPKGQSTAMSSTRGVTDTNGIFFASGRTHSADLFFGASKNGYYKAHLDYELGAFSQYDREKWSPTITLALKKINKPISMYAKRIHGGPPIRNKPVGFDLFVGDWVAPHGKGLTADLIFTKDLKMKSSRDYESKIVLTFPNPGDGIQEFHAQPFDKESELKSPHEAPEDGYQSQLTRENSSQPGQPVKFDYDPQRNYFIRVHTVLDENGNVKSALYGKIYGDFMQFRYYLNPTPNSRVIEFDPKQNLVTNLKSTEQVDSP
jgi:hypothetical protein